MAISVLADTTRIHVAAGYESGHTMVYVQNDPGATFHKLYSAQTHSQPGQLQRVLSSSLTYLLNLWQYYPWQSLQLRTITSHHPRMQS